jgi:hypothetical protein
VVIFSKGWGLTVHFVEIIIVKIIKPLLLLCKSNE